MCIYTHNMFEKISAKDVIVMNQRFADGRMMNQSSLLYALDQANKTNSWLRACAVLVRAILVDHVFEEGNKRTAAGVIVAFLEENENNFHPENIAQVVAEIVTKNITDIITIERLIKNVIV